MSTLRTPRTQRTSGAWHGPRPASRRVEPVLPRAHRPRRPLGALALALCAAVPLALAAAPGAAAPDTSAPSPSVPSRSAAGASVAGPPAAGGSGPAAAAPLDASPEACRREVAAWRAEREAGLKSPNGWLTLAGLFWLDEGDNSFGSDPSARVVLPAGKAPAVAGTLVRHGREVEVRAQPGVELTSAGKPVSEMKLDYGAHPTVLNLGSLSFFLIARGDRLGVRVKDSQSPILAAFHGVDSFPVDPTWCIVARFEPRPQAKSIPITNILGMTDDTPSPGVVVFEHGGTTYRLDALGDSDKGLFLIFADRTSGSQTYGAGRFLDTEAPQGGRVLLDFNEAYNPPCAFTPYATCPLPPPQNHLAVAVTAGEKKYAGASH